MRRNIAAVSLRFAVVVRLAGVLSFAQVAGVSADLSFTAEEQAWLDTHPHLRVGSDPAWPPYSKLDAAGQLHGIDRDVMDLIAKRTGIVFDVVPTASWAQSESMAKEGKLDVLSGTAKTAERATFARFTRPYAPGTVAVITRTSGAFLTTIPQLEGCKVAAPRGYVTTEALVRDFPAIRLVPTDTDTAALRAVARGDADATVGNLTTANYTILSEKLDNLKIAGVADYSFDLCFAVTVPGPAFSVLDKTLASIPHRELLAAQDRWVGVEFQRSLSWRAVRNALLWAGAAATLIVLVVLLWNRALSRELARRRKVERALSAANDALQAADREKSGLMQMLAHDLNGPLGALGFVAQSLAQRLSGSENDQADSEILNATITRMKRLMDALLNADAIETGQRQLAPRALDLATAARVVVERFQGRAAEKRIALRFHEDGECTVRADELALDQAVENLVSNGLKFTPPGGSVDVNVEGAELRVADTGPGVIESERSQLFEKFSRLSAKPTDGESSHGLGLAIVKRLLESMGGSVHHEPREGGGSVFVLRVPR